MEKTGDKKEIGLRSSRGKGRAKQATTDPFYILATAPQTDGRSRVLKHGETFAIFDHYGDITSGGLGEEGLFHAGTRFLSCLLLRLGPDRPLFLSSTVRDENDVLDVDLTNPDISDHDRIVIPRGTLHIARSQFLWNGTYYQRMRFQNYGLAPITFSFSLLFAADFADIFEVRGMRRAQRGHYLGDAENSHGFVLAYEGLDRVIRRARLEFSPLPSTIENHEVSYVVEMEPKAQAVFFLTIACEVDQQAAPPAEFEPAFAAVERALHEFKQDSCQVSTGNERFNPWLNRSIADLHMMVSTTRAGPYPYAGVPWFSTPFGRDGLITALECLWFSPPLARGVLAYLASCQAAEDVPARDAEPGKILHEARDGEMAALGEIPFGRYYGSVDATPLFIMLAGAYYQRTGDLAFIKELWPNLERALQWLDTYGDLDGDGFVEYQRRSSNGLIQQGWKDSYDAVFHADGTIALPPIALCEVQGYAYAARCHAAELARALGWPDRAQELSAQAEALRQRFEKSFWCEELSTYALALDREKHLCQVRTSNAGHCLFTGIASPERARRIAKLLMEDRFFSGWGVRTLAASEARYNPMSYHNGSVWPHDNALIAGGLARYGYKSAVLELLAGMFEASRYVELHRMPELFCGFVRGPGEGPTLYPVACAPQAWAAGAVFLLLQAALGLEVRALENKIIFSHPLLPAFLKEVHITNLQVGTETIDLVLQRHAHHVGINVMRKTDVEIAILV
jgi:glycogen debranching enzyme